MKKWLVPYSLFIYWCLSALGLSAQPGNNWYFGKKAAISFATSPPTNLFNSQMYTLEGCSSISDAAGQLLFYTNGELVYNRNHQVMANGSGLLGHRSSSSAALIVKKPGNDPLYYIFTSDAAENEYSNGYRYSVVDMNLNGGLGDVVTKNVLLYAKCSEKLAAVRHGNGVDIWIITRDYVGNAYRVYLLGCNGVSDNAVVSNVGLSTDQPTSLRVGALKASPNGTLLANIPYYTGWELFQFNNTTGSISNPIHFNIALRGCFFGLQFSPDSKLLYLSNECGFNNESFLYQYKTDVYDSLTIASSRYLVDSSQLQKGDMQMGPDGKIYVPNQDDPSLNVINNPNQYGPGCNFAYKAINLGPNHLAARCLPNYLLDDIINPNIDFSFASADCRTVTFSGTTALPPNISWHWDFGDGNTDTGQVATHTYLNSGNFAVTLHAENNTICGAVATIVKYIILVQDSPVAKFGLRNVCGSRSVQFLDSSAIPLPGSITAWQWKFGDGDSANAQNPQHVYANAGTYRVQLKVTSGGLCPKTDTVSQWINIFSLPVTPQWLARDSFICGSKPLLLIAGTGYASYAWQNGSTDSAIMVTLPGDYIVSAIDFCGNTITDTITVQLKQPPTIALGNDTTICSGKPLLLNAGNAFVQYQWNTGNTAALQLANQAGMYSISATDQYGCMAKDTLQVLQVLPSPLVSLNKTAVRCVGQNDVLQAGGGYASYLWQNGSTDSLITITNTGLYTVTVGNNTICFTTDSVRILTLAKPPSNFLPADSSLCDTETLTLGTAIPINAYTWSNGANTPTINIQAPTTVWLQVTDKNNCVGRDTVTVLSIKCTPQLYVPVAFTPNGDGLNDHLRPVARGLFKSYVFTIFNRYGQRLFQSTEPNKGWDGLYGGQPQNRGAYIWQCTYQGKEGPVKTEKGSFLLLR